MKKVLISCLMLIIIQFSFGCTWKAKVNVTKYLENKGEKIGNITKLFECNTIGWQGEGSLYVVYKCTLQEIKQIGNFKKIDEQGYYERNKMFDGLSFFEELKSYLYREYGERKYGLYSNGVPKDYWIDFECGNFLWKFMRSENVDIYALYEIDDMRLFYYVIIQ